MNEGLGKTIGGPPGVVPPFQLHITGRARGLFAARKRTEPYL